MEQENGLREMTKVEREAKRVLEQEQIPRGSTIMAAKRNPGTEGDPIGKLRTNLHGLIMREKKFVYRYDVTVIGTTSRGKQVEMTKRVAGDAEIIRRRETCAKIFGLAKQQHSNYFQGKEWAVYYDQQAILYSRGRLYVDEKTGIQELTVKRDIPEEFRFQSVLVRIKRVEEGRLLLTEFPNGDAGNAVQSLSLEQFLNVASNQNVIFHSDQHVIFPGDGGASASNQIYLRDPQRFGFNTRDYPDVAAGVRLGIGCSKSARFIEGPEGHGGKAMALLVQAKKTPFHKCELVINKARNALRINDPSDPVHVTARRELTRLDNALKGLFVDTIYDKPRNQRFKIHRIHELSARQKTFDFEDRQVTVEEYFEERYGITLRYPDANLIVRNHRDDRYYPMELCQVSDNQKVNEQQQKELGLDRRTMVQNCSMQPDVLLEHNRRLVESLSLEGRNNAYMESAGLNFLPSTLLADARRLVPPSFIYRSGAAVQADPSRGCTWQSRSHYLEGATCEKWAAYCLNGVSGERRAPGTFFTDPRAFESFVRQNYVGELHKRGMAFNQPDEVHFFEQGAEALPELMQQAADKGMWFVLLAHADTDDDSHHSLKFFERRTGVITQGLKIGTISKVLTSGQPLTVQNIGAKTNVKLGGLNYSIDIRGDQWTHEILGTNTLYIGFGVNHPAGGLGGDDEVSDKGQVSDGYGSNGYGEEGIAGFEGGMNGNGYVNGNGNGYHVNGGAEMNGGNHANGAAQNGKQTNGNGRNGQVVNKAPSVIGYSANMGKNPFEFIGDFVYQTPRRDEKVGIIRDIVKHCVKTYTAKRGGPPKRLIIYRNGCSDGQFRMILEYEIPLIKNALEQLASSAKVTVIVSNKVQRLRLFAAEINSRAKPAEKNIQPGTVVDTGVVHPSFVEFCLSSARALQGTARCPKYSVLYDDNGLSMDQLENITYQLCYGHQIVNMPVSLPSPVYIAEEYAKRGRNLYRRATSQADGQEEATRLLAMTYGELTKDLSFRFNDILGERRINA